MTVRILHVISGLTRGGVERQLIIPSRKLLRHGHKVLIATAQPAWVEQHAAAERLVTAMEAVYTLYARNSTRTAKPAAASWTA